MSDFPSGPPEPELTHALTARVSGHNIAKRVFTAVTATGGRHLLAILAGIVIARGLGPTEFGNFMFLLAGFTTLHTLLDLSVSQGFYTFICRQVWPVRLYALYGAWIAAQFILPVLVIWIAFPHSWIVEIWRGQPRLIVLIAFFASFAQRVFWQLVIQVYEAARLTIRVQITTVSIMALHLAAVVLLHYLGLMTISVLFWLIGAEYAVGGAIMLVAISRRRAAAGPMPESTGLVLHQLLLFVGPLVPSLLMQSANGFAETWMLQIFGGSEQQAFFGVAQQYANIGLIFGFSTTNVFWKELTAANARGDVAGMHRIYVNSTRVLFLSATLMVGFAVFWTGALIHTLLGAAYDGAAPVFAVTLLTSISQCFGIVCTVIYSATSRTRIWSIFTLLYLAISFPGSILVLWLWKLGAIGLALKLTLLSTGSILLYDWYISRQYGWKTDNLFRLSAGVILFAFGWASHLLASSLFGVAQPLVQVAIGLAVYLTLVLPLLFYGARRFGYLNYLRELRSRLT